MHSRYQLIGRLETGELAELYLGQRDGSEAVAVQLLQAKTSDPRYAKEIAAGARALAPVDEPRFLRYLEVGMLKGRVAVVREHVDGITLADLLQRLPTTELVLSSSLSLWIVMEALDTLDRAHQAGIAHGSLAPSSLVLARSGQVMIAEMGSLAALQATPSLKAVGVKGRDVYRAPELTRDPPTELSDIYSMGAIAYQLLTRREPSGGGGSTRRDALVSPSRVDRRLNGRIDPIILRALEASAARRFRTAQDFATALRNFLVANGGVPSKDDLQKFAGDALKAISFPLGPSHFVEPFSLAPIEATDIPDRPERGNLFIPEFVPPPIAEGEESQFGKTDPDQGSVLGERRVFRGGPDADEGTDPATSGSAEVSWVAPPGAAPAKPRRTNSMSALPSARPRTLTRNPRLRVIEDFIPGTDAPSAGENESADSASSSASGDFEKTADMPAVQVSKRDTDSSLAAALTPDTGRAEARAAFLSANGSRRRRMIWIAGGLGLSAVLFVVFVGVWGSRPAPQASLATAEAPKAARNTVADPTAKLDDALQKYLSEEERALHANAPLHEPVPESMADATEPDESTVAHKAMSFLTLNANAPAIVFIDGIRLKKRAPLTHFPVEPGERKIVVEQVTTHEQLGYTEVFQKGKPKKLEAIFKLGR